MRACHLLSRISTFAHPVLTTLNALPTHPARTGLGACPCSGHLLLPQQVLAQRMRGFGVCRKEDMKTILTLHFCTSSVQAGEQRASWRRWHRAAGALPSFPQLALLPTSLISINAIYFCKPQTRSHSWYLPPRDI